MAVRRLVVGCALACAAGAEGQEPELNVHVNCVYAAQFGFGAYEIGDLTVNVYALPLAYTFRDVYRDGT